MTGQASWRSLRTVMLVTIHVAVISYAVRSLARPSTLVDSLIWVPATISVAVFLSWPVGRAIASWFDPGESGLDRLCPTCGRLEIRPLIRPGAGLFQPPVGYRCAACWTTFRQEGDKKIVERPMIEASPADPSGIDFLSDLPEPDDIRFLDEPSRWAGGP